MKMYMKYNIATMNFSFSPKLNIAGITQQGIQHQITIPYKRIVCQKILFLFY